MKKLIMAILLTTGIQAHAGNDGGGGGVICFTKESCITLAEAGLRIKRESVSSAVPQKPVVSYELTKEMELILKSLPLQKNGEVYEMLEDITNVPSTAYEVVEYYDEKKFKRIKNEYYSILKDNNFSLSNLSIAAVSNSTKTYLLPQFFKLNLRSQALILIHEAVVRFSGSVILALEFDGHIVDALNGAKNTFNLTRTIFEINNVMRPSHSLFYAKYLISSYLKDQRMSSGKKYKLTSNYLIEELTKNELAGLDLANIYASNELYNLYPDLWNILKTAGITKLRILGSTTPEKLKAESRFTAEYSNNDILRIFGYIDYDDVDFCENTKDGLYISGSMPWNRMSKSNFVGGDLSLVRCTKNFISEVNILDLE